MTRPRPDLDDLSVDDGAEKVPTRWGDFAEFGISGVVRAGGYVDDEFLRQLSGRKGVAVYREMGDNDSTVNSLLFAYLQLLSEVSWTVEPASSKAQHRADAERVEQAKDDMAHSWSDFVREACSFLQYGWSLHEMNFKRRLGPWYSNTANHHWHRSKYSDGQITWHSLPIRAQETLLRWQFHPVSHEPTAMIQMAAPDYRTRVVPLSKSVLFRTGLHRGNPEGRSILRGAYQAWYMKKRLQEFEAIGVERDLAGLPIAKIPAVILNAAPNTKEAKLRDLMVKTVRGVRRNEGEGVLWPLSYNADGHEEYIFELLNSGGSRQFDTTGIIDRYKLEILQTSMTDFIQVGHEGVGSYSMHADKRGLFQTAGNSFIRKLAENLNRVAVPPLFSLNGEQPDELPRLVPGDVDSPALDQLVAFMTGTASLGMQWFPDPKMEKFVRDVARVPAMDRETEQARETEQRQARMIGLAQQRLEAVQIAQQAEQGALGVQQQQLSTRAQAQELEAGPAKPGTPAKPGQPKGSR